MENSECKILSVCRLADSQQWKSFLNYINYFTTLRTITVRRTHTTGRS